MSEVEELFKQILLKSKAIYQYKQSALKQEDTLKELKVLASSYCPYQVGDKHPKGFIVVNIIPCFSETQEPIFYLNDGKDNGEMDVIVVKDMESPDE